MRAKSPAARGHHVARTVINAHVAIRTKAADAPNQFPPARLFLDDIDEIARILVEAAEKRGKSILADKAAKIKLTLTIKDQVCDDVEDLPKIATKTFDLAVSVAAEDEAWLPDASLEFDRHGTSLTLLGFPALEKFSIYHKLAPIFRRRNLRLATLIHSQGLSLMAVAVLVGLANIALLSNKLIQPTVSHVISSLSFAMTAIYLATVFHHSTIILRRSSDRHDLKQELLQKMPMAAISSILTFLLTLLGFYIKHKYLP